MMSLKMRELVRICLVCLCVLLLAYSGRCEDVLGSGEDGDVRDEDGRKDGKAGLPGSVRRTTTQASANTTRDSQLLSLLAARRRQLLTGRLAAHINTLASIANKSHKGNTTFAQLEIRDTNNSIVKRLTFDNSSNEATPTLKLVTTDGNKEIRQDVKAHEIRHLFIPKVYHDKKSRAGFINNRRKETFSRPTTPIEVTTVSGIIYVPEKLEETEKEVELDPDEEFQVDESNHGLYLLNYSEADNITQAPELNKTSTIISNKKEVMTTTETPTISNSTTKENTPTESDEDVQNEPTEVNTIANSTDNKVLQTGKVENEKDKENNTLFMSDELYNHFRPLESELAVEDMAPFIYFGQKIGGQIINDNLTNSPSLSASTKSVNIIAPPPDKRRYNSRYSATEKYKNTSAGEDEVNDEMDVSVVQNIIEKNKVRNTVKGPAPARHVGLVNAYRKYASTTSTTKPPNIAQLNVTDPIILNVTPRTVDKVKETVKASLNSTNNSTVNANQFIKTNNTQQIKDTVNAKNNVTSTTPRNYTRNYFNLRRRPSRLTAAPTTDGNLVPVLINATTEKVATSVYTAVVTSVSITSSMKGPNKTDSVFENGTLFDNTDLNNNGTVFKAILLNSTETPSSLPPVTSTNAPPSTHRPYKHRIRIRTTTTESSINASPSPVFGKQNHSSTINDVSTKASADLKQEATTSRISERLANLFRQNDYEVPPNTTSGNVIRPKNILKRRRPTTTSTTSTTTLIPTLTSSEKTTQISPSPTTSIVSPFTIPTTKIFETTESTFKPFIVTSRTSSESSSKPLIIPTNSTNNETTKNYLEVSGKEDEIQNEEVVIEAEKTYTASYVLAGLGFLPVAAIVAFLLRNFLNKKTKEIDTEYEGYFDDAEIKKESPITPVARPPIPTPTKPDTKWEFPRNKLRLQTLLGQGNFGQVWKAEADDLTGHDGLTRLVAVKSIKETASQKEKQELLHEIYVMQKIGTHPNVVTLLGCCTEQEPYLLIMEYVMCGKLLTYLRERRARPDRFSGSGALTSRDLTVFAYCVARGMDYIASKGIVHRDLAARNVLVDHNKLCKIADFGMSRAAGGAARARGALPVRWMAPEALLYSQNTHQTDVWAFGILLWEIVTLGSTPYANMSGREVVTAVTAGYRLERPAHCAPSLFRAMSACWTPDPDQRPSFAELKSQLADLLHNEPSDGNYVDLDSFYQESSVYSDPSAIIPDEDGLSAEYDRERRCFRELNKGPAKYDNRAFNLRDEELRNKFGSSTPRMGGFGIRDVAFNDRNFSDGEFNDRTFTEKPFPDRNFTEKNFPDRNFADKNFADSDFTERKDGKLSTSSFHRERESRTERERENPLVSRNSFNGFPRIGTREGHFQIMPDGRNKRVSEFECDI